MNRNFLKYIAIIAMTLDHIAVHMDFISPTLYLIFRIIGRITMPIMCFFIVEGFFYTKNKKNYALRLLLLAIVSQPIWCLLHNYTIITFDLILELNTVFSLLLGFLLLWVIEGNQKLYIKAIYIVLIIGFSFLCDYQIIAILYVLFFYLMKDNRYKLVCLPALYIISIVLANYINNFNSDKALLNVFLNIGLFLTIPLFYLYNGEKGSNHKLHQYSFYFYYPVHLLILSAINFCLVGW